MWKRSFFPINNNTETFLSAFTMPVSTAPSSSSSDEPIDLLFLGTGTSTGLPLVPCLTRTSPDDYPAGFARHVPLITPPKGTAVPPGSYDPAGEWPDNIPCACCRSAVSDTVPEGWKNRRGNTSVVVRKQRGGRVRNVVVDVGKTFKEQTQRFFPKWGIQSIDAVILTHGRESHLHRQRPGVMYTG